MNVENDENLGFLAEMFPSASISDLSARLNACNGNLEQVVDQMTKKRKNLHDYFNIPQKQRVESRQPREIDTSQPSAFDALKWKPEANAKRLKNTWTPLIVETDSPNPVVKSMIRKREVEFDGRSITLHHICLPPVGDVFVTLVHDFLPPDVADSMLDVTMEEAKEKWARNSYVVGDRVVVSPHTSAFYASDAKEDWTEPGKYEFGGKPIAKPLPMPPPLQTARDLINQFIASNPPPPSSTQLNQSEFIAHPLELEPKDWIANCAVANCYKDEGESVGWHSDRLTSIGVMPTICSITVGATRSFRLRPVGKQNVEVPFPLGVEVSRDTLDNLKVGESRKKCFDYTLKESTPETSTYTYVLPLPHNTLLVMHRGVQERYRHDVCPIPIKSVGIPPIIPHPKCGKLRFNYTFRVFRDEYVNNPPKCHCGNSCDLRSVNKFKTSNFGKYFWSCAGAGEVDETPVDEDSTLTNPYWQPLGQSEKSDGLKPGQRCGFFLDHDQWLAKLR